MGFMQQVASRSQVVINRRGKKRGQSLTTDILLLRRWQIILAPRPKLLILWSCLLGILLALRPQSSQALLLPAGDLTYGGSDPITILSEASRFTRDPLGEQGGVNLTAFCEGDPVKSAFSSTTRHRGIRRECLLSFSDPEKTRRLN